jgi:BCD family chlorophyll transporter-like MFS transporter
MLAYSAQELILEPFAGLVYRLTPGASAQLSGTMHGGAVLGMVLVAVAGSVLRIGALRSWVIGGCVASAAMLVALAAGAIVGAGWPLHASVFALGVANGAFAVAAIGAMMELAGAARDGREGVRMGLWGGAQAVAFAIGGIAGTGAVDLARHLFGSPAAAYAVVFGAEALLFLAAARIALAPSAAVAVTDSFTPLPGRDAAALSR